MNYLDKNGIQIEAGMTVMLSDGSSEKVYACVDAYGNKDLGINASNDKYMKAHGLDECDREFYPLSNFRMSEIEVTEAENELDEDMQL